MAETDMESGRFEAKIDRTEVAIDSGSSAKIEITDSSGTARLVPLPNKSLSEGKESSEGSVHYEVEDGTRLIAQPLQDASVRLSVAITDASQPQEFSTI